MRKNRRIKKREWFLKPGVAYWIEVISDLVVDCCLMLSVVGAGFLFAMWVSDRPLESSFLWLYCGLLVVFVGGLLPGRSAGYRLMLVGGAVGVLVIFVMLTGGAQL
jgi:hypothetical protein